MPESESTPKATQGAKKPAPKSVAPSSNPQKPQVMYCTVLRSSPKGRGVATAKLSTKNHGSATAHGNHPIAVGMTGAMMGIPGRVEVVGVGPGSADVVVTGVGIEKQDLTRYFVVIEPDSIISDMNDANIASSPKGMRTAGIGGSPR